MDTDMNSNPEVKSDGLTGFGKKDLKIFAVLASLVIVVTGIVLYRKSRQPVVRAVQSPVTTAQPTPTVTDTTKSEGLVNQGLTLQINSPGDNAVVTTAGVNVSGLTKPGAEVNINDFQLKADAQGRFSKFTTLEEGDNTIDVSVNDDQGNYAERSLTVTYNPASSQTE